MLDVGYGVAKNEAKARSLLEVAAKEPHYPARHYGLTRLTEVSGATKFEDCVTQYRSLAISGDRFALARLAEHGYGLKFKVDDSVGVTRSTGGRYIAKVIGVNKDGTYHLDCADMQDKSVPERRMWDPKQPDDGQDKDKAHYEDDDSIYDY